MKILYDYQIFEQQSIGGISRYFSEIISNLSPAILSQIAIRYSNNLYLQDKNLIRIEPITNHRAGFIKGIEFKGKGTLFNIVKTLFSSKFPDYHIINRQYSIEMLKKQDFDVFHPTYYDDYFFQYIGNKPFVLTIHDMAHELFPEFYCSTDEVDFVKRKATLAKKASHIIAVSENTKNYIIEILGIPGNKISVIYHATNEVAKNEAEYDLKLPSRYLLYVGDRAAEYKNFKFFIRAVTSILKENRDIQIVCTGKAFDAKEKYLFESLGISEQMHTIRVDDNQLAQAYQHAISFIYPSYCEGFGIPILEAFINKCPVILSNASCFKEIAGNAALYFEPKSMDSLKTAVRTLLQSNDTRSNQIRNGEERLKVYSWEKAANQTLNVYKSVLQF